MFVESRDFGLPHLHSTPSLGGPRRNIAITFDSGRTRVVWLPDGGKNEDIFIRFGRIHERDGQTAHDGIGRAYA